MASGGYYSSFLDDRAAIGRFFAVLEDELDVDWVQEVAFLDTGDDQQETETYKFLGHVPQLREWLGQRNIEQLNKFSQASTLTPYELTLGFMRKDLRRDKLNQTMARVGESAKQTVRHWAALATDVLENNDTAYTGSSLYNATHSLGDQTVRNLFTSSEVPALDVADVDAPTQTEMSKIILGLIEEMYDLVDDQGNPANGGAREFRVIVPTKYMGAAFGAINADRLDGGDTNILKSQSNFAVEARVNPRFDSSNDFVYVFRIDTVRGGLIAREEGGVPLVSSLTEGSDIDFLQRRHLFGVETDRDVVPGEILSTVRGTLS